MIREPISTVHPLVPATRPDARRYWRDKFREAFRGIQLGVRGHSSFSVHFFCAAVAVAASVALNCRLWEWCLILLCIGAVFTAELFNSAIETLFHGLDPETRGRWNGGLDIAAGAVLTASLFSALTGAAVFGNRFGELMRWWD
ncbi:MAG TPA: diacylglycerol kinase [Gemmataceae bacterium]|nr:diacylglycerol kinase [Gemmataceae bacterium]